jgi:molecular chaperone HtpG
VSHGAVDLGTKDERKKSEKELKKTASDFEDLLKLFQELLEEDVKEVRITNRLTSSPACLVGEPDDMSPQIIGMLGRAGQDVPKVKRILEVNPSHPILEKLHARFQADKHDAVIRDFAVLIYGQALLAEGSVPSDPAGFSKRLADVMAKGL